jgi:uncharacterized protein YihD (DUF1040 family)
LTVGKEDLERPIQVALVDTESGEAKYIPLPCKPAEEVFDLTGATEAKGSAMEVEEFLNKVKEVSLSAAMSGLTAEQLVRKVGMELDVDNEVIETAITYLGKGG